MQSLRADMTISARAGLVSLSNGSRNTDARSVHRRANELAGLQR